jgi:hypothetical protein
MGIGIVIIIGMGVGAAVWLRFAAARQERNAVAQARGQSADKQPRSTPSTIHLPRIDVDIFASAVKARLVNDSSQNMFFSPRRDDIV